MLLSKKDYWSAQVMKFSIGFEVTGWEPVVFDESHESAKLSQVTITKKFSGEFEGEGSGRGVFCECADGSASYVVAERVTGRMDEREGSFVIQHGGIVNKGEVESQFGDVVPGSGTGDFEGITGTLKFQHDESGALIHFDIDFN